MTRRLRLVLRVVFGAIFLYAAYTKLRHPSMLFALTIDSYGLLPSWAVVFVAQTLPWFELVLGVLLLAGVFLRWTSTAGTLVLACFFALLIRTYSKGMAIECGCFGLGDPISPVTLTRDGLMLAGSGLLMGLAWRRQPAEPAAGIIGNTPV